MTLDHRCFLALSENAAFHIIGSFCLGTWYKKRCNLVIPNTQTEDQSVSKAVVAEPVCDYQRLEKIVL